MSRKRKKRVNVSLDPELYRRAKMLGLNVSGVSERALCVYLDRLENGSGQPSVVLDSGDSVATPATATPTNSGESSTNETDGEYVDASVDDVLNDYRQFDTGVLNRSEGPITSSQ